MAKNNRARAVRLMLAVLALSAVAACKTTDTVTTREIDEGVTDYRKATINDASKVGMATDVSKKYSLSEVPGSSNNRDVPIVKDDMFYVSLLQAFVGNQDGLGYLRSEKVRRRDIAIVLRVRDSNDPDVPCRFVFYSDDVEPGQFLNFSNLLTLGPTQYRGGVITIDVDEIYLGDDTKAIEAELRDLAGSEDNVIGPAASRATWNARARNLFAIVDNNVYTTRYTLTLLPSGGVANLPYARFEAGNYVLMRHRDRDGRFEWSSLNLDNNTGRLIYPQTVAALAANAVPANRCSSCATEQPSQAAAPQHYAGEEFRGTSYVTLQINALRNLPVNERPEKQKVKPPEYRSLSRTIAKEKNCAQQADCKK